MNLQLTKSEVIDKYAKMREHNRMLIERLEIIKTEPKLPKYQKQAIAGLLELIKEEEMK